MPPLPTQGEAGGVPQVFTGAVPPAVEIGREDLAPGRGTDSVLQITGMYLL